MLLLNVPFAQKDEAKALGARWDKDQKKWYVPDNVDTAPFLARPEWSDPDYVRPPQVPQHGPKWPLFVDLVPRTAWFSNLRKDLTDDEWTAVKRATSKAAGGVCEVCTCTGPKWPVECHERWSFDPGTGVQTLMGTVALCPACHEATHFGLARVRGRAKEAADQLMAVNGWNTVEVDDHVEQAMRTYAQLSRQEWRLDARWLLSFVELSEETSATIIGHAEGLAPRTITTEEQGIRDAHAHEGQGTRRVMDDDPFEVPA